MVYNKMKSLASFLVLMLLCSYVQGTFLNFQPSSFTQIENAAEEGLVETEESSDYSFIEEEEPNQRQVSFVQEELKPAAEKYQYPAFIEQENLPNRPGYVPKTTLSPTALKRYNWVVMFMDAFDNIVFGDKVPKITKAHNQCIMNLASHKGNDDEIIQIGWNGFWEFCYKPDNEEILFDIIHRIAEKYLNNFEACDAKSGLETPQTIYKWFDEFQKNLAVIVEKHRAAQKLKTEQATWKFYSDAQPGELEIQNQLKDARADLAETKKGVHQLADTIEQMGNIQEKVYAKGMENLKEIPFEEHLNEFKEMHKEDWLQLIQITAEHADFFCREEEALADHFGRTLKVWKQLLDGWAAVMHGDTFP